jgi:hypothetical protein
VLPGDQYVASYYGYGGEVFFSVSNTGTVSYDPSLQGVLTGSGTSTLRVNGAPITIDATALSLPQLGLDIQIDFASAAPLSATVLPGIQYLYSASGYGGSLFFNVGNNGAVSYDRVLVETLSGQGTPNLVVNGDTVQVNAAALSSVESSFTLAGIGSYPIATVPQLTLMPGWENFYTPTVTFNFHVDEFSRIDYDPVNDGVVSGRNTSTLMLLPPLGPGNGLSRLPAGQAGPDTNFPPGAGTGTPTGEISQSSNRVDAVFGQVLVSSGRVPVPILGVSAIVPDFDPEAQWDWVQGAALGW